ncbi:MAG: hypothetical protein G01um10145_294 [Microgenomates group bacterium Gr01-1014_5]|nr:MAG: hypothetical protein G01um10145_294 [Microgenomates group bacterium Gr01-1014_5]
MAQGRCVGCGRDLTEGKSTKRRDGSHKVICSCGRIFVNEKNGKWRRALLEEV